MKGSINPDQLHSALPVDEGFSLLSWGPAASSTTGGYLPAAVVREVLSAAAAGFALVLFDAGRLHAGLDGWLGQAGQVLLLAGPGERGLRAAAAAAAALEPLVPLAVIRGPVPAGMDEELAAERLRLPLGAYLPRLRGVAAAEHGGRLLAKGRMRAVQRCTRALLNHLVAGRPGEQP
ncbi:hypothetical protein HER39_06785 [Arthrobacter deserti]|uniref:Alpha/beta hydrolase n=1 Tax=Arthrobacter deserti TaxID=1742687 RepID=A0ABX1JLV7_9MICC|nr:hypothetical protein [Arthrobacter deserti]